jgi:hypothetical protein
MVIMPHKRPSTTIGTATPDRIPSPAEGVTGRAGGLAVVVGASRAAGAQDLRHGQGRLRLPAAAHRQLVGGVAGDGDDGHRAVGIEAGDGRGVGTQDATDLLRDGRKHLRRRYPAGDQRGDPPQRGLLFGEHAELLAALGVRGHEGFGLAGAARGQPDHRADRARDEEERDQAHHIVELDESEVVQRPDEVAASSAATATAAASAGTSPPTSATTTTASR